MSAGYKDFTAGAVLTAADLEDYCELQGIMRFASASARDTALSTVKTEGMFAYLIDVNTLTVYTGSAWSTIGPAHGALTSWTPAVVQSGSVTTTNVHSTYMRIGRLVIATFEVTVTGSGTGANLITVSTPISAIGNNADFCLGPGKIYDSSTGFEYTGFLVLNSSSTAKFQTPNTSGVSPQFLGSSGFTAGLASSDALVGTMTYEAATDA